MRPPFAYPRLRKASIGLGIVFLAWLGWTGVHAWQVAKHLTHAQDLLNAAQDKISARDLDVAKTTLAEAGKDTKAAKDAANGIVWRATAKIPILGRSFDTVSVLTSTADAVARKALPPAIDAARDLDGKQIRKADGSIDFERIRKAQAPFTRSVQELQKQLKRAKASKPGLSFIATKRADYLDELTDITDQLGKALAVSKELPDMLGASGSRRYFMGFLVNAEARATGGYLGSYAILRVDNGKLTFEKFGDHADLKDSTTGPVVDLGSEFERAYAQTHPTQHWTSSTGSPDFPSVGKIWLGLWKQQYGQQLDGAIATDPVGLSFILRATGPVTLTNGEQVTADNVVSKLESEAYQRFGDGDQTLRKLYLLEVAAKASQALVSSNDPSRLFSSLQDAATDNRLRFYFNRADEQKAIADTVVSGALSKPGRPLGYLIVDNFAGNKMEYYLKREVTYRQAGCGRLGSITVKLTNLLKPEEVGNLTDYVAGSVPTSAVRAAKGSIVINTSLYLDKTAVVSNIEIDGKPDTVRLFSVQGLSAASKLLVIPAGTSRTLELVFGGDRAGTPRLPIQPLVQPQSNKVVPPMC